MHERPLTLVERPWLVEDRGWDRSLADVMQLGREVYQPHVMLGPAQLFGDRTRKLRDALDMLVQGRVLLGDDLKQGIRDLPTCGGATCLVGIHALIGEL